MANFDLSSLALKSVCPNNEIFVDDADLPSVMVYIPKFKNSDVLTGGNDSTRIYRKRAGDPRLLVLQVPECRTHHPADRRQYRGSVQPAGRGSGGKH